MADGQQITFDDIQSSLNQYRQQKQRPAVTTTAVPKPPAAPNVPRLSVQKPTKMAAPPKPPTQKPEPTPKPQGVLNFDTLTSDLAQRRQQRGDSTPVTPREPKGLQISGAQESEYAAQVSDKLGTWAASKLTLSPEQVKRTLDKVPDSVFKAAEIAWGIGRQGYIPSDDQAANRREAQKLGVISQKIQGGAIKEAVKFVTDPVNVAFMMSGEFPEAIRFGIDLGFSSMMTTGAIHSALQAMDAGEKAHWNVFATTSKDGTNFEYTPEAAAFWSALGDAAVQTFFARTGVKGAGKQADYLHTHAQFNKTAQQQFGKPWVSLTEEQKAVTTAVVSANHAKGVAGIQEYQQRAKQFGLKDPFAGRDTASLIPELNAQLTKHRRALQEADLLIENAPEKRGAYEMEPPPILGGVEVEKKSKIWTPEGEKEVTVKVPDVPPGTIPDYAILSVSDREYVRQQNREAYAKRVVEEERQRRLDEYGRKAQQLRESTDAARIVADRRRRAFEDSVKRETERRQRAAESGLKIEEKRPLTWDTAKAERLAEALRSHEEQMDTIAREQFYFQNGTEQMLRYLHRPNRDAPYTPEEQNFLEMAHHRDILRELQDPRNLAPVTVTGEPIKVGPPKLDVVRERLADVTNPEQARQVLDGTTEDQLAKLMIPLNQAFAKTGAVYGRAGERPLFTDNRGEVREGSSWNRTEGVDVIYTAPVHPEDVPKWAIPGDDGRFILQVTKEGEGKFGSDEYVEPQVVLGKVDSAAKRQQWDWTDWAAQEQLRRDRALIEDIASIDRQNELENSAAELSLPAGRPLTAEEAEARANASLEAENMAKAIEQERAEEANREKAKEAPKAQFTEGAPIKELARGRATEITLPSGRKLKAHYALVSLDDLVASHLPMQNFQPNENYIWFNKEMTSSPLQPNDYRTNKHRQDETKLRASMPDFGQIFNTSSTGDQGPPTVRRDGIVAGGNNREFILEMLYAAGRGNEVVNAIEASKAQFGIEAPTPPFEDNPAIVRVLDEPLESKEEVIDVGEQLNRSLMTKKNAAEDAAATALRFTPEMMDWIVNAFDAMDDDASLRDFMRKYATQLADRYEKLGIISHNERGAFINDKGEINADAKLKFERAVRGAVIKDPVALSILEQPGMAAQAAALDRALPGLLRMVAKGGVWDVSDYLAPAIRKWESINDIRPRLQSEIAIARDHGQKGVTLVDTYLYPDKVQGTTRNLGDFGPEPPKVDKITESLMRLMEMKPKDIREAFNGYSLDAEGRQATLTAPPEPWEAFETHIGSKVGVQVDQSDWGRLEAKPEPKAVSQEELPPSAPAVPEALPEKKFKYGSTQTDIPDGSEAAKALTAARERISDADTMEKGKDVGGNHVTVRYGIDGEDTAGIKAFLAKQGPFEATLGKTEAFPPSESSEGAAPIIAPIEAPELHRLNDELGQHGNFIKPTFKEYKPHATIAYVKPEAAKKYVGMDITEGKKFLIESISITNRDGSQEVVKLQGLQAPPTPPVAVTPGAAKDFKGTKVADAQGNPLTVYHATNADFEAFDPDMSKAPYGGVFFSEKRDTPDFLAEGNKGKVVTARLNIQNPLVVDTGEYDPGDYADGTDHDDIRKAKEEGHDGVIYKGADDSMYVVFRPEQIQKTGAAAQPLEAPPTPPVAVTPEAGGTAPSVPPDLEVPFGEEALRKELAKHSGISPAQREGMIQVWKAFTEKYLGVPFDQWVRNKWSGLKTGGEYKGEEGLQQGFSGMDDTALKSLVRESGRNIRVKKFGEQGALFGEAEPVYNLWNEKSGKGALVTQSQLDRVKGENPRIDEQLQQGEMFGMEAPPEPPQGALFQEDKAQPIWYSKLSRTIEDPKNPAAGSGEQWLKMLENKGVKRSEIEATGLDDFLKGKKKVTRDELAAFAKANQIQVTEVMKGVSDTEANLNQIMSQRGYEEATMDTALRNIGLSENGMANLYRDYRQGKFSIERDDADTVLRQLRDLGYAAKDDPEWKYVAVAVNRAAILDAEVNRLSDRLQQEKMEGGPAKYGQYALPGGENYRELLLTLPDTEGAKKVPHPDFKGMWAIQLPDGSLVKAPNPLPENRSGAGAWEDKYVDVGLKTYDKTSFRGGHFEEPNVLAHVRFDDRTDADGNRVLFVEELQSDWHQKGRKQGYAPDAAKRHELEVEQGKLLWRRAEMTNQYVDAMGKDELPAVALQRLGLTDEWFRTQDRLTEVDKQLSEGVPDAPWKKDWHELALRRILRHAAENGYDKIAWTTGEQQAERYDLSNQVDGVGYKQNDDGTYEIFYRRKGEKDYARPDGQGLEKVTAEKLPDVVGKELAQKIVDGTGHSLIFKEGTSEVMGRGFEGVDLKVGGSGMKGFYDKIIPDYLNRYGKKFGAKVGETEFTSGVTEEAYTDYDSDNHSWTAFWRDEKGNLQHLTDFENSGEAEDYAHKKSAKPTTVHSLDLTPELRQSVLEGQPLFQGEDKVVRGMTTFGKDGVALMHLFEKANFSTFAHESFHIMRRYLKPEDTAVLEKALKVKDHAWTTAHEEKAARSWEKYLRDGKAPNEELKSLFAKVRAWMVAIYQKIKGGPLEGIKVSPEVKAVFDRMLTGEGGPERLEEPPKPPSASPESRQAAAPVDSPEFRNWFDKSKVVKDDGTPVTVYHGSASKHPIEEFRGKHYPGYFTESPDQASSYAVDREKEAEQDPSKLNYAAVYPSYLSIKNPLELKGIDSGDDFNADELAAAMGRPEDYDFTQKLDQIFRNSPNDIEQTWGVIDSYKFRDLVKSMGYDGIKMTEDGHPIWIPVEKEQIRSALTPQPASETARPSAQKSVQDLDKAPLSPSDKSAESLLQLLQEDPTTDRDKKIKIITERLKGPMHPDIRKKFEGLLAQLQGEAPKPVAMAKPPVEAKAQPKPVPAPLEPAPRQKIKIWTPSGEIEVEREEPTHGKATSADTGRRTVDGIDRDKATRPTEQVPEQPRPAARGDEDEATRRSVPTGKRTGGKGSEGGTVRESLPDVKPTRIDAPKRGRGTPLYSPEEWTRKAEAYGLPKAMPAPFVSLDSDLARLLIFPGQRELAESVLSGLQQHDAFILASTTGTGKTYLASAVLSQIMRREKPKNVLILTKSQNLVRDFKNVALDFDVNVQRLPDGVEVPPDPGTYATTYATARMREGLQKHNWDFVIFDEIAEARRWYDSQQGGAAKDLAEHAGKVLYMSATPFHTALELGHMTKLGLWDTEGFDQWGKQFGIYRDKNGNYGGGNAPKKLVKLRQQLIERGSYANIDRNMEGYNPHFLLTPMSPETKQGLRNIVEAFDLAKDYYARKGKLGKMRSLQGNMVVYMKSYLERQRLPEAIELGKRAEREGYKAIFFSEHKAGRDELFSLLEEPDAFWGGKISEIFPRIPDVVEELQKAFPNNLANFSGSESVMRSGEKDAFIENEKKHIYATYGAGGIGVSLHDTNGKYPRVAIYLGPPYSGVMLDQAIGRPWRYGTKSNVQAYFLVSNARDEVDLVIKKVGPRLESLRALVSGIDMKDPLTMAMRKLESSEAGALGYDLGQEHDTDKDDLVNTYDHVPIMNWREAPMPSASEAMNKGMKFPGEGPSPHPGIERMMQADEYEPPKELVLPDSVEARIANEQTAEDFANGEGAHGMTEQELQDIPKPTRVGIAESVKILGDAAAKENPDAPQAAVRREWENAGTITKSMNELAKDIPPPEGPSTSGGKALHNFNWIWATRGYKVVYEAAKRGGAPEVIAKELELDRARYHQEADNVAGELQDKYSQITDNLTNEEHDNMFLVVEGATRKDASGKKVPVEPMNEKVAAAVPKVRAFYQSIKDTFAKKDIYIETFGDDGGMVPKYYADKLDNPNFAPHLYDYDREIVLTDPETGAKEKTTLREVLKGKQLGASRYERMVRALAKEHEVSEREVEDWLNKRKRDVPLIGNVERAREVDMPYYRTDRFAVSQYLHGVGEVIARQDIFGQNRGKLRGKILQIPDGPHRRLVSDIYDQLLVRRRWDDALETRGLLNFAGNWVILTKMTFSGVKVPFHAHHAAFFTSETDFLRGLFKTATNWKEVSHLAEQMGAIQEQLTPEMLAELSAAHGGFRGRLATKMLHYNLFVPMYKLGRIVTTATDRVWLDRILPKLLKRPQDEYLRRQLKEERLFSDEQIDQAIANRRWSPEDYRKSGTALSNRVMFSFDPLEVAPGWRARADSPISDSANAYLRIATLLRSFMFKTAGILKDRLWTEAKQGNFRPWIPLLIASGVTGELIRQLNSLAHFDAKEANWWLQPENHDLADYLQRYAENVGIQYALSELYWMAYFLRHRQMGRAMESAVGSFYEDVAETIEMPFDVIFAKTDDGRYRAFRKWIEGRVPASRIVVKAGESLAGRDEEAIKHAERKASAKQGAETRREKKYGHAKPL